MHRYSHHAAIFISLALMMAIFVFRAHIAQFGNWGYLGVFLLSVVTTLTIVVPVPGWAVVVGMGAVLNPLLVGLVSGAGGTIGEMNGYLLGYGGSIGLEKARHYDRVMSWMRRWGAVTLFVFALIPNPLFDLAGLAAGTLKYPVWKYLLYGGSGRLVKYIGYAYAGHLGLRVMGNGGLVLIVFLIGVFSLLAVLTMSRLWMAAAAAAVATVIPFLGLVLYFGPVPLWAWMACGAFFGGGLCYFLRRSISPPQ